MTSDEQDHLVRRAIAGEREACGALWHRHERWISAVLMAHMPHGADLDDLRQEVAMRMCQNIGTLRDPASLPAWLRSIAVNTARSDARRGVLRHRIFQPSTDGEHDFDGAAIRRDLQARRGHEAVEQVLSLVRELAAEYREPLLLRAVEGLSQKEIAAVLGVPETTVETRLARARRMLRQRCAAAETPLVPLPEVNRRCL